MSSQGSSVQGGDSRFVLCEFIAPSISLMMPHRALWRCRSSDSSLRLYTQGHPSQCHLPFCTVRLMVAQGPSFSASLSHSLTPSLPQSFSPSVSYSITPCLSLFQSVSVPFSYSSLCPSLQHNHPVPVSQVFQPSPGLLSFFYPLWHWIIALPH